MAGKTKSTKATKPRRKSPAKRSAADRGFRGFLRRAVRALRWAILGVAALVLLQVLLFAFVNSPYTPYMLSERARLGELDRQWVDLDEISPHLVRAVVAAEDANFCLHWGFDMSAIRNAIDAGAKRGASTLSQQVVKNLFLWQGRSWPRKALEAGLTPVAELAWSKRRIVELYLNIAEFGDGVFGAEAAARRYFRTGPEALTLTQAARLAAVLPDPKGRNPANPSSFVQRRAQAIADGAETIRVDGRADCLGL